MSKNMIEKISSLHDDVLIPKTTHDAGLGEYSDYPERFNAEDKSVLERLGQFGVDIEVIENEFGKKITELTWHEYNSILAEAIRERYDVIVASVYDQYMFPTDEDPGEEERIKKMFSLVGQYEEMGAKPGINLV